MLRAGIVFGGICLSVCLFVCSHKVSKSTDRNWCSLVGICPMVNARSGWWLVTFDLESYFCIFLIQGIYFEWLYLATLFSVWRHIFRISRSRFNFKVMGPRSKQWKSGSMQLNNYWPEIAGAWIRISVTIMLEVIWCFWPLTLRHFLY